MVRGTFTMRLAALFGWLSGAFIPVNSVRPGPVQFGAARPALVRPWPVGSARFGVEAAWFRAHIRSSMGWFPVVPGKPLRCLPWAAPLSHRYLPLGRLCRTSAFTAWRCFRWFARDCVHFDFCTTSPIEVGMSRKSLFTPGFRDPV